MDDRPSPDDERITLRVPRSVVAAALALVAHVVIAVLMLQVPEPVKRERRVELTLVQRPPPAPTAMSPAPRPVSRPRRTAPPTNSSPSGAPPSTSPVLPELPPSEDPPENRAQLPIAEASPAPAPPPEPTTWKERLLAQLAATRPTAAKLPTGPLAPSFQDLDRVAVSDARLHDEETEQRLMQDEGPFFRRGLEALRGNWHPQEVLDQTERDPARRCGRRTRTTFAVAVLNRAGDVVDVELKNPSGCPELDDEAVAAFKRVARFPHPPDGIFVAPDGTERETARYPVRFIVTFDGGLQLDWR